MADIESTVCLMRVITDLPSLSLLKFQSPDSQWSCAKEIKRCFYFSDMFRGSMAAELCRSMCWVGVCRASDSSSAHSSMSLHASGCSKVQTIPLKAHILTQKNSHNPKGVYPVFISNLSGWDSKYN